MKIKAFVIRLDKDYYESDQNKVNDFLDKVIFKKSAVSFVEGNPNFWTVLIHYEEIDEDKLTETLPLSSKKEEPKSPAITEDELTEEEIEIVNALKKWRFHQSELENLPAFMILTNSDIYTVARAKPEKLEDFLSLRGFGEKKTGRYGSDILALLNSI